MILKTKLLGHVYEFKSVKDALAKANEEKSGDRLAGIAAENAEERVAAKVVVANLTLADLRANPAVPYEEDEVTRIIRWPSCGSGCWMKKTAATPSAG